MPGTRPGDQEVRTADVGVEHCLECCDVLIDSQRRREAGGVVDDDVDLAALLHQRLHRLGIGHIGRDEPCVGADRLDRLFAPGSVAARDDDRRPFTGEQPRGFQPDTSRSTR